MNFFLCISSCALILLTDSSAFGIDRQPNYEHVAEAQAAENSKQGPRHLPVRDIPIPTESVSPQMKALIGAPYIPIFNAHPKSPEDWKKLVKQFDEQSSSQLPKIQEKLNVKVTSTTIGGVKALIVTPTAIPEKNKNRLLVHVHGGGYVFGSGDSGALEAILMAGIGGFKIISIDYRMPPDYPYPAPLDDSMTVWKEAVKMAEPKNMAIFGSSTGGAMTLAIVLRTKDEHLPLPAAIAPGTPWSDLNDIGDSYKTNEWLDNILVTWDGWLGDAAQLYAGGQSMKDPYLSPIYGNFYGFPPAILTTGTRDLFLSNTIRTHRKLRLAGVEAELNVYEGQSHCQYLNDPDIPEVKEIFSDIANFFDKHLGK